MCAVLTAGTGVDGKRVSLTQRKKSNENATVGDKMHEREERKTERKENLNERRKVEKEKSNSK